MSEFVKGLKDKESELQYNGNAFLRLMGYLKPYIKTVLICFVLVSILTALDLYLAIPYKGMSCLKLAD